MTRNADFDHDGGAEHYKRLAKLSSWVYLGLIGVFVFWQVFNYGTPEDWIEKAKLNSLGDFLAGVFAPIAFIWVAVAVFVQSKELAAQRAEIVQTRKEYEESRKVMEEQAAIAIATARANYQFSLFDKRVALYTELELLIYLLNSKGRFSEEDDMKRFTRAVRSSKYVFGADVKEWLDRITAAFVSARRERGRVTRFEHKLKSGGDKMTDTEEDEYASLELKATDAEGKFMDEFDFMELDRLLEPFLTLPDDIKILNRRENNRTTM